MGEKGIFLCSTGAWFHRFWMRLRLNTCSTYTSGVSIGCAVHTGPSLGAQTNPAWEERGGGFWNHCTRARSNLATRLRH